METYKPSDNTGKSEFISHLVGELIEDLNIANATITELREHMNRLKSKIIRRDGELSDLRAELKKLI
jgi:hypothetical protein